MTASWQGNSNGRLLEISPVRGPCIAELLASPSKSITHRAILMGLLVPHVRIENPLLAADTLASLRFAQAMGARVSAEPLTQAATRILDSLRKEGVGTIQARHRVDPEAVNTLPTSWQGVDLDGVLKEDGTNGPAALLAATLALHVEGPDEALRSAPLPVIQETVDLGNSGTTLRLGAALAALAEKPVSLTGDESLLTRPMGPLADALGRLGASCGTKGSDGRPPVVVQGPMTGGETALDGQVSSQFISAVLLAAHGLQESVTLRVQGRPASVPYVRLTIGMLRELGGHVDEEDTEQEVVYRVPGQARLHAGVLRVPGDWSSAAFPLVAAAITGGRVRLSGLDPASPQGDRVVLDALGQTGCTIQWIDGKEPGEGPVLELIAPDGPLSPVRMNLNATPDLLPPLGALAARAAGTSRFTGVAHARIKETDRLAATARGLEVLGFDAHEEEDALEVTGDPGIPLPEATIETHGDHRILMAFAVLGLTGPGPVRLTDPGCYHVSYPRFRLDVDQLGGATSVVSPSEKKVAQGSGSGKGTR